MTLKTQFIKTPALLIFVKFSLVGFLTAEIFRLSFHLAKNSYLAVSSLCLLAKIGLIFLVFALCLIYAYKRGAVSIIKKMVSSWRVDIFLAYLVGVWFEFIASSWFLGVYESLGKADPLLSPALLVFLSVSIFSPLCRYSIPPKESAIEQLYFMSDDEIKCKENDLYGRENEAEIFADSVLKSRANNGLVVGVDGPWGIGKTSFINLASRHWESKEKVIVCRMEPIKYFSQENLVDRFVRDLTSSIQRRVFAPEFRPAVSRYSRILKGKAEFTFMGFRLSLEPSQESADDLLDDIDEVLRKIGCRIIVVLDDLDRLDVGSMNKILVAARNTFKLSQATYILCYDTENIIANNNKDEGDKARDFIEKFVTVKHSLFVDSSSIYEFLTKDWSKNASDELLIPSDTMSRLASILTELANMLKGESAEKYISLAGDMRKVKRFVNAMLLMRIEKSDLGRTDFNNRDLINLVFLNLVYPGLFRRIYSEEAEGRSGIFSVFRDYDKRCFKNKEEFISLLEEEKDERARFLLKELFDVGVLGIDGDLGLDKEVEVSRACFNHENHRNLESYLKLIVRFSVPEPHETFVLYRSAVKRVMGGVSIPSVLEFNGCRLESSHDKFWSVFVSHCKSMDGEVIDDAVDSILFYLPYYSFLDFGDRGLRKRAIYTLIKILDDAGWAGRVPAGSNNSDEKVVGISCRIFGENAGHEDGIIGRLVSETQGVLGWYDLMLFRLICCADRLGQFYNIYRALILYQESGADTGGRVSDITKKGMRHLSQRIFKLFRASFIDANRNFFNEVDDCEEQDFFGRYLQGIGVLSEGDEKYPPGSYSISATRSLIKSFVIYQLSNSKPPTGGGVGCGFYDQVGDGDNGGIAYEMNKYLFDFCFSPEVSEGNTLLFLDYCMSNLSSGFFSGADDRDLRATEESLVGVFDKKKIGSYWRKHRDQVQKFAKNAEVRKRKAITINYVATYGEYLDEVFRVLDAVAEL